MRKCKIKPLFHGKIAALTQLGDKFARQITRDMTDLSAFGITAATRTQIQTLTSQLKKFPDDKQLKADVSISGATCKATASEVRQAIRDIAVRAKRAFGVKTAEYRSFGTNGLSKKKCEKLKECADEVVKVATEFLPQLSTYGLTQAIIDSLESLSETFRKHIVAANLAIKTRDRKTQDRIILSNQLYTQISSVSSFGKTHFAPRSEAKYNDYRIYPSKSKKKEKEKGKAKKKES